MNRTLCACWALAALCCAAEGEAQDWAPRHGITLGVGAATPQGVLSGSLFRSTMLSAAYGYRFHPYFQADTGVDVIFGAARVREFQPNLVFGDLRIRDDQVLVPFGGRAILPVAGGRAEFSAGGGGAYIYHGKHLEQPSEEFEVQCRTCTSRSGWAWYGLAGGNVAVDALRHVRLGVTARLYRGHTDGGAIGSLPGLRTADHWLALFGEVTVQFWRSVP